MIKPDLSQKNCLSEKLSHSDIRETNNSKILPKDDAQRLYIKQYIRSSIEYLFKSHATFGWQVSKGVFLYGPSEFDHE